MRMGSRLSNYFLSYTIRKVGQELPSKENKLNLEMDTDFESIFFSFQVRNSFSFLAVFLDNILGAGHG